ncbi:MAG TPA: hypothetical protein PKY82_34800, partial [Pyrinomonadaceae bacterium]|nr:hypothetical protein [Pyrinomonadaceae bacterium]
PACNRTFSDDTLSFCLEDGIPLIDHQQKSHFFDSLPDTVLTQQPSAFQIPPEKAEQAYQQLQTTRRKEIVKDSQPVKQNNWGSQRLMTKLYLPPVRQTLVDRPHLVERLNEGLKGKLTIISAPAGFGKTSLVMEWRQQSKMPLVWFSLDEEDNEPLRFLDYLLTAFQLIDEKLVQATFGLLQSGQTPPMKVVLSSLLNEICQNEIEFVLALDDYHLIHKQIIHDVFSFFIEQLPLHAHVIILTRSDPPFPLARLRARGELKEIRESDLKFNQTEANAFLNKVMNLDLTSNDVLTLEEKTEGWITGLQLSALSLQGRENKAEFVKELAGDDKFILDYLLEEVLHFQTEKVQDFLLRTSVLNRLNGSLCDALTNSGDGHETLEYLNRSNLFLIPLDNKNNWFRYHHLFADLLRFKLKQKQADEFAELQSKASIWCEENGLFEEAINYALAAKDWGRALKLVEPIAFKLISVAKFERVQHWAESIPKEVLKTSPMVCYWYVPTLLYKEEFDKAEEYLQIIGESVSEEMRLSLLSALWASRCYITLARGDLEKSLEFSLKAFEALKTNDPIQHSAVIHTKVACALLKGKVKETEEAVYEALPIYREANHFVFEVWARTYLGFAYATQGKLREGAECLQKTISYAKENVPTRPDP